LMQLIEKHFDTAFAASDGIKKLRELILTLAMQGKLVPQGPDDQPASELLQEIAAEKKRLVKEGKIKQPKQLPNITPEEMPYALPECWEWVRLNDVLDVRDGTHDTPKYVDVGFPLITSKNLYTGKLSFEDVKYISTEDHSKISDRSKVDIGDILFAMIGSIGNPVIVDSDEEFSIKNVALFKFYQTGKPDNRFLHFFLIHAQENMKATSSGAVQSFVSLGFLRNYLFPLPPLAEQRRIVTKIDQLMARCDELEKLRAEREQKRLTVHTAALSRLLEPSAPSLSSSFPRRRESSDSTLEKAGSPTESFGDDKQFSEASGAWRFITKHFGELYSVKENVAELRKAILQLAVMGKLVPQDPHDQPASELLQEIAAEKKRLVREGKLKTIEPFPEIKIEDQAHPLPNGWSWVRLGEIAIKIGSGSTPRGGKSAYEAEGIPFLRSQNIWNDGLRLNDVAFISAKTHKTMSGTKVVPMDILLNITGASLGRCALVQDDIEEANVSQHVTIIRTTNPNLRRYVHQLLLSPYCQKMIWTRQVGMAREGLSKKVLEQFEIPLPPLAEQHRIVAKIDQLMALCDAMEQQIDAATGKRTALLNAVMAQV